MPSSTHDPGARRRRRSSSGDASYEELLEWLAGGEAQQLARKRLALSRVGARVSAEDVVADVVVQVMVAIREGRTRPLENPAAYGTKMVINALNKAFRGAKAELEELVDDGEIPAEASAEEAPFTSADVEAARIGLERAGAEPWLTSAALAYVCLASFPDEIPPAAPEPKAGSKSADALAWPALWFAGCRDLFPDLDVPGSDPRKRARARHIQRVRKHVSEAIARQSLLGERQDYEGGGPGHG